MTKKTERKASNAKGKKRALAKLMKAGKAMNYVNSTWKMGVVVILCSKEEAAGVIEENVNEGHPESERVSVDGMSGLTLGPDTSASRGGGRYMMWVDTEPREKCLAVVAHEAVHVAGLALSSRGVDCDIEKSSASECIAYLVEDIVNFTIQNLVTLGVLSGKTPGHRKAN